MSLFAVVIARLVGRGTSYYSMRSGNSCEQKVTGCQPFSPTRRYSWVGSLQEGLSLTLLEAMATGLAWLMAT